MSTAQEVINESLAVLGTYDAGGSPSTAESADALNTLNFMLSSWSADEEFQLKTYETFNISAGVSNYSWVSSTAASFNSQRPIKPVNVMVSLSGYDFPVRGVSRAEYDGIPIKTLTGIPEWFYYDKGYATGTVYFFPAPATSGTVTIASVKELTSASALSATLNHPGEILEAVIWNLSVRLAPKYGIRVTPEIAATAVTSLQRAKRARMDDTVSVRGDSNFFGGNSNVRI